MVKKILFPIGAGDDVAPRIYGALLVAKWFKTHVDILTCQLDPSIVYNMKMTLRGGVLFEEFLKSAKAEIAEEHSKHKEYFDTSCKQLGIDVSDDLIEGKASASFLVRDGKRSAIVECESKFYDMVVAAVPLNGKITGTFESAVMKSGKNVVVIPRNLEKFEPNDILISWTGTPQSSRALTSSIPLLKQAKRVHCITSRASLGDDVEANKNGLEKYLKAHDINATFEVIDTTSIPGVALLKAATDGKFDLIVAGRHGENGLREMVLGGTSRFFLEHTHIPVFM
ncbi:universal stress protein [Campylobacter mucosalis]|uniref:universal stress protein n=1 Tax=Campylobacter mucosalis TaxID=202 RepID=UPI0004D76976|nr:universal stress protein [Campylobacter mucosalis]KEA45696.1 universal stress protein [Campylobacter mucosalis]QKF63445.1 putative universal stress protein UspA [Campylobacter mucosalis]